jgi:hypothetical protein
MYGDYYSGIYTIWCQRTGRVYIGQTLDVRERGRDHKSALQSEIRAHGNRTLQEDWQWMEAEGFPFAVRERYVPFDPKTLRAREQVWCKHVVAQGYGLYNHGDWPKDPTRRQGGNPAELPSLPQICAPPSPVPDARAWRNAPAPYGLSTKDAARQFAEHAYAWWLTQPNKPRLTIWAETRVGLNAYVDHVLATEPAGSNLWTVTCWTAAWRDTAYRDDPVKTPTRYGRTDRWGLAALELHDRL